MKAAERYAAAGFLTVLLTTAAAAQLRAVDQSTVPKATLSTRVQALLAVPRRQLAVTPKVTRQSYVDVLAKLFDSRDTNQDMFVSWQKPSTGETLAPLKSCVIVKYQTTQASKIKDPTKPGVFVETPASTTPVDWEYLTDRLAQTSFQGGECQAIEIKPVAQCYIDGKLAPKPGAASSPIPGLNIPTNPGAGMACALSFDPKSEACKSPEQRSCESRKGEWIVKEIATGACEKWTTYGPDSTEAFRRVAAASFDAEDWNKNGRIDGKEGQYLCTPG